jgi:hypothetical protein
VGGNPETIDEKTPLPVACLRGLRKANWLVEGETVSHDAFMPDTRTGEARSDGMLETSINWEDSPGVEQLTLRQANASHGAARLHVEDIDYVRKWAAIFAERRCLPDNPHHGNLLFNESSQVRRRMIANALALAAKPVRLKPQ